MLMLMVIIFMTVLLPLKLCQLTISLTISQKFIFILQQGSLIICLFLVMGKPDSLLHALGVGAILDILIMVSSLILIWTVI